MKLVVVIDAQVDFLTGTLANEEAVKTLPVLHEVVNWAAKNCYPITYTKDTHFDYFYLKSQEGKNLPIPHCLYGTPGWQIVPAARPDDRTYSNFVVHEKEQFGYRYWRNEHLEQYDEIIVVGYDSDVCGISNVLIMKAFYPETPITFISNASAGITPESHAAACTVMKSCQVNVKTWEEYLEM